MIPVEPKLSRRGLGRLGAAAATIAAVGAVRAITVYTIMNTTSVNITTTITSRSCILSFFMSGFGFFLGFF